MGIERPHLRNGQAITNQNTLIGTLTVLAPASGSQPTQTLNIPVSIAVGVSFTDPTGYRPPSNIYLPLIVR